MSSAAHRYLKYFTVLQPSTHNICDCDFTLKSSATSSQPTRTRDLRPDTLAQILAHANIHPGSRALVVEDTSGVVVGAMLARMGGEGTLLVLHENDSPPGFGLLPAFNFHARATLPSPAEASTSTEATSDNATTSTDPAPTEPSPKLSGKAKAAEPPEEAISHWMKPFRYLHWAAAEKDYNPIEPAQDIPEASATTSRSKSEKDKVRLRKRREAKALVDANREDLFAGEWDAYVSALLLVA